MRSDLILMPGRFAGRSPKIALAIIAITIGILMGWIGPEDYPPECRASHADHVTYVAEHPGDCE